MVGWSVKALKRRTQVTTGKAKASFFPNRRGNQVRSREKIPVFGEQDDWTRLYDFIQPLVLQMESHTRREWKRYWIVKKGKLCFKKKKKKKCSWVLNCTGRVFLGRRERGKKKRNEYKKKKITLAGMKKKKGTIMGSLLLSLVYMLATTCIYLQVMVIHQLPEGSQIMMVLLLWWGVQGKSLCDVASGSLQPLRCGKKKTCTPSLSVLLRSPRRGGTGEKKKNTWGEYKVHIAWSKGQLPGVSISIVALSSCRWFRWFWPKQWFSG